MLQRLIRAPFDHSIPVCHPRLLPQPRGYLAGGPGSAATSRRAQTKAAASRTEPSRPLLLEHAAEHMAVMVGCSDHCETGHGVRMASGGFLPVLAMAIATARRPTQGERRDSDSYSPDGSRKYGLGSTEDPRGTSEARRRGLRAHCRHICDVCGGVAIRQNAGSPSSLTIVR